MPPRTRWHDQIDASPGHSQWYITRFRDMAAAGTDIVGEARLIDAMLPRGARVLDAGCGPGRLGGYLHSVGHRVVGIDVDPELIAAAETDYPGPTWLVGDLAELDLPEHRGEQGFEAIVCAGNVMTFLAPGTETAVLQGFREHLASDGRIVTGFQTSRELALSDFDAAASAAGLTLQHRFATWDLRPWREDADFCVTVLSAG